MVQLSCLYITTGKIIALTVQTFVGKVMSLLFNTLSRFDITFLPWSKHLLISWERSPSALILEPKENKICHSFHFSPIYLPWSNGTGYHDLSFLNVEGCFFFFLFNFFSFIFISWRLITLQYCSGFCHRHMNQPWIYMYSPSWTPLPPPSLPAPSGSSQCTRPERLSHASNLGWWSVSP